MAESLAADLREAADATSKAGVCKRVLDLVSVPENAACKDTCRDCGVTHALLAMLMDVRKKSGSEPTPLSSSEA